MTAPRFRTFVLLVLLQLAGASPALEDAVPGVASPEPAAEAIIVELPFEPWHEPNRVVLNLAPGGQKPFRLMLDTGAEASVITPRMARSLGVSVRRLKSSPYRKATSLGRDLQFHVNTRRGDTASNVGGSTACSVATSSMTMWSRSTFRPDGCGSWTRSVPGTR